MIWRVHLIYSGVGFAIFPCVRLNSCYSYYHVIINGCVRNDVLVHTSAPGCVSSCCRQRQPSQVIPDDRHSAQTGVMTQLGQDPGPRPGLGSSEARNAVICGSAKVKCQKEVADGSDSVANSGATYPTTERPRNVENSPAGENELPGEFNVSPLTGQQGETALTVFMAWNAMITNHYQNIQLAINCTVISNITIHYA